MGIGLGTRRLPLPIARPVGWVILAHMPSIYPPERAGFGILDILCACGRCRAIHSKLPPALDHRSSDKVRRLVADILVMNCLVWQ